MLRKRYTDGVVDEIVGREGVTYEDLARAASGTGSAEPPSVLRIVFHDASGHDALLATWIGSDARDDDLQAKAAIPELVKLARARLGLVLPEKSTLAKLRALTLRYVLAGEFRSDLRGAPPASLDAVPLPPKTAEGAIREVAKRLRNDVAGTYPELADRVERELGLATAKIPIENKRTFLEVSAEVVERVDPVFYGDPRTAAHKALT